MRLEIPDDFDVAPLIDALNQVAATQGHRVTGSHDGRGVVFTLLPDQHAHVPAVTERREVSQDTSPGLVVLEHVSAKVVPITLARMARRAAKSHAA